MASALPDAQQWPRFRGFDDGNIADDPNLPDTWSETENIRWKTDIPGTGWSSPIIWGEHVFLTATIGAGAEPQPIKGLYDPGAAC
jgi:outer membrane protein assembly factor BamB